MPVIATLRLLTATVIGITTGVVLYTFGYAKGASYLTEDPREELACHRNVGHPPVKIDAAGEFVGARVESPAVPPLAGGSWSRRATGCLAPEEACRSLESFQPTRPLRRALHRVGWGARLSSGSVMSPEPGEP